MKVDEFVRRALIDITEGVSSAQQTAMLHVAPGTREGELFDATREVEIEVAVSVSSEGSGGVSFLKVVDLSGKVSSESVSRIKFSVPVCFNSPTPQNPMHYSNRDKE